MNCRPRPPDHLLTTQEWGLVVAGQGSHDLVYCSAFQKMMPDLLVTDVEWQAAKAFPST